MQLDVKVFKVPRVTHCLINWILNLAAVKFWEKLIKWEQMLKFDTWLRSDLSQVSILTIVPLPSRLPCSIVFVKDSILGNWPKYERRRREKNRARSASTSAEGARVRRRRKASAASLSPEAQEIPRSGIESLLLWPNSYRLQVTLPVKIGSAPSRRSTDLLPKLTQHAAI